MRRKGTADVDALRTVEVVVSFQLDSLVVVTPSLDACNLDACNLDACKLDAFNLYACNLDASNNSPHAVVYINFHRLSKCHVVCLTDLVSSCWYTYQHSDSDAFLVQHCADAEARACGAP